MSLSCDSSYDQTLDQFDAEDLLDFDVDFDLDFTDEDSLSSDLTGLLESDDSSGSASPMTPTWDDVVESSLALTMVPQPSRDRKRKQVSRAKRHVQPSTVAMLKGTYKTPYNMSRKKRGATLVAFPTFDKCDSLLFFPTSLARCFNTGDNDMMTKLIRTHFAKDCVVDMSNMVMQGVQFIDMFDIMTMAHPDFMCCVSNQRVVGDNEVQALMLMKYTDVKFVYDSMCRQVTDPTFKLMFNGNREEHLNTKVDLSSHPEDVQSHWRATFRSNEDVVVYGRTQVTVKFEPITKKIQQLKFGCSFSSINPSNATLPAI